MRAPTLTYVSTETDAIVANSTAVRALQSCRSGMIFGATVLWITTGLGLFITGLTLSNWTNTEAFVAMTMMIGTCTIPCGVAAGCVSRCAFHLGRLTTADRAIHLERAMKSLKMFWIACAILPIVLITCVFVAFYIG